MAILSEAVWCQIGEWKRSKLFRKAETSCARWNWKQLFWLKFCTDCFSFWVLIALYFYQIKQRWIEINNCLEKLRAVLLLSFSHAKCKQTNKRSELFLWIEIKVFFRLLVNINLHVQVYELPNVWMVSLVLFRAVISATIHLSAVAWIYRIADKCKRFYQPWVGGTITTGPLTTVGPCESGHSDCQLGSVNGWVISSSWEGEARSRRKEELEIEVQSELKLNV